MKKFWKNLAQTTLLFMLFSIVSMMYGIDASPLELSGSPKSGKTPQSSEKFVLRTRSLTAAATTGKQVASTNLSVIEVVAPNEIKVTFFDDAVYSIIVEKETLGYKNSRVYSGKIKGQDFQTAVVIAGTDGSILLTLDNIFTGISYTVSSTNGNILVKELDYRERSRNCNTESIAPPKSDTTSAIRPASSNVAPVSSVKSPMLSAKQTTFVDVMVVYDNSGISYLNGAGNTTPTAFAQVGIDKMNTALANSGVTEFTYRLVYVKEDAVDYTYDASKGLSEILYSLVGWSATTANNALFQSVRELRETYGADMVTCFTYSGSNYGNVGVGFARTEANTSSFNGYAYNVVNAPNALDGHTLTHEIGHNIGAGHSRTQAAQRGPQYRVTGEVLDSTSFPEDYSAGYQVYEQKISSAWEGYYDAYTIMAYGFDGDGSSSYGNSFYVEVPCFSAPKSYTVTYYGQSYTWTIGSANADNTRLLKEEWTGASAFRPTKVISDQVVSITNAPSEIANGTPITLTATSSFGYNSFSWAITSGSDFATINAQTGLLTPKGAGTVTVQVTEEGTSACNPGVATANITITSTEPQAQTVTIVGPATMGLGTPDQFTATTTSGSPVTWTVTNGTGTATIDATTGYLTPTTAGTVTVTASVAASTNYNAASTSKTITIVNDFPTSGEIIANGSKDGVTITISTTGRSYSILRATSIDGSYTSVRTGFTGGSFVDTTAIPGKTYYYKLRAE